MPPNETAGERLLLTEPEAARLLSLSPRTLWGLAERGEVPSIKIGRAKRYRLSDLQAYVASLGSDCRQSAGVGK